MAANQRGVKQLTPVAGLTCCFWCCVNEPAEGVQQREARGEIVHTHTRRGVAVPADAGWYSSARHNASAM